MTFVTGVTYHVTLTRIEIINLLTRIESHSETQRWARYLRYMSGSPLIFSPADILIHARESANNTRLYDHAATRRCIEDRFRAVLTESPLMLGRRNGSTSARIRLHSSCWHRFWQDHVIWAFEGKTTLLHIIFIPSYCTGNWGMKTSSYFDISENVPWAPEVFDTPAHATVHDSTQDISCAVDEAVSFALDSLWFRNFFSKVKIIGESWRWPNVDSRVVASATPLPSSTIFQVSRLLEFQSWQWSERELWHVLLCVRDDSCRSGR